MPQRCNLIFELRVGQALRHGSSANPSPDTLAQQLRSNIEEEIHQDTARLAAEIAAGAGSDAAWERAQFDLVTSDTKEWVASAFRLHGLPLVACELQVHPLCHVHSTDFVALRTAAGFSHLFPASPSGYLIVRVSRRQEFWERPGYQRSIRSLHSAAALVLFCVHPILFAQGNSWTKLTSGYWEEPYWSLGQLPARGQGLIALQNPGWKALAIGSGTVLNYPGSLAMDSLTIEGPADSFNVLLLNYPGLDVPLTVDGTLLLGTNASVVGYSSALHAGNFYLSSPATFSDSSIVVWSNIVLGATAPAQLSLTNSSCDAQVVALQTGGELLLDSGNLQVGQVVLAGGTNRQNGGSALISSMGHQYPPAPDNFLYLSGGALVSGTMNLGWYSLSGFTRASFYQSGGVHINASLSINGGQRHFQQITHVGNYTLSGGLLVSTGIVVYAGTFSQTGGTNYVGDLGVSAGGYYTLSGGQLVTSNTTVSTSDCLPDVFVQTGGVHVVQNTLQLDRGATYTLANGNLSAPFISINGQAGLSLQQGGILSNPGIIVLGIGGVSVGAGVQQFGKLQVAAASSVLYCQNQNAPTTAVLYAGGTASEAVVMRFADSRDVPWSGTLKIQNWSTNNAGSGPDHLYFGTNSQGLTSSQLAQIVFVRPDDPSSDYSAAILSNGEIVPAAVQNFTYTSTNNTVTITGYTGSGGDVIIPATINGLPVTVIGDQAFYGETGLTSVTMPDTISSIGARAFYYCTGLTTFAVPNSVTSIGDQAFFDCDGLTNIFLGTGVAAIGQSAFEECGNLLTITVATNNTAFSSLDGVLFNKTQTILIKFPEGRTGTYQIPNSVTQIGDFGFITASGLTDVTIPGSVTNIGYGTFEFCTGLTNLLVPNGVATLGDFAFFHCPGLTNMTLPGSITSFGARSFEQCGLRTVTIGAGVQRVGNAAFASCPDLLAVYFGGDAPAAYAPFNSETTQVVVYYLPGTLGWGPTFGERPTAPWSRPNPVILGFGPAFGFQSDRFGFVISWATNRPVAVEAETDLATGAWLPLSTNSLTNGWSYFSDPETASYSRRFYRARAQ